MHSGEKSHVEKALDSFAQLENIHVKKNHDLYIIVFYKTLKKFKTSIFINFIERSPQYLAWDRRMLHAFETDP
jgi:hypothetical protein